MRTLTVSAGVLIASGWLFAQTSTTTSSAAPVGQAYTGVLVDASCLQISGGAAHADSLRNRTAVTPSSTSPGASSASYGQTPSTSNVHQPTSEARMQSSAVDHQQVGAGPGGATDTMNSSRNRSNSNTAATAGANSAAGNTAPTGNYSSSSGTNSSSSVAATNPTTSNNPSSNRAGTSTGSAASGTTTGTTGSGYSTGTTGSGYSTGTTGSGYNSSPTGNANSGGNSNTSGTTGTVGTGATGAGSTSTSGASGTSSMSTAATDASRNRTMSASSGVSGTSDYSACRVTPATTSYALVSNGRVILLDPTSNQRVASQLQSGDWFSNSANSNRDLNVSVNGSMQGENLSVTTLSIQ